MEDIIEYEISIEVMMDIVLRSKKVLTHRQIIPGDIIIKMNCIEAVKEYGSQPVVIDFGNMLIAPGMVDLHSWRRYITARSSHNEIGRIRI
jgi:dihydroorotase-like cyclic amidohydrolase